MEDTQNNAGAESVQGQQTDNKLELSAIWDSPLVSIYQKKHERSLRTFPEVFSSFSPRPETHYCGRDDALQDIWNWQNDSVVSDFYENKIHLKIFKTPAENFVTDAYLYIAPNEESGLDGSITTKLDLSKTEHIIALPAISSKEYVADVHLKFHSVKGIERKFDRWNENGCGWLVAHQITVQPEITNEIVMQDLYWRSSCEDVSVPIKFNKNDSVINIEFDKTPNQSGISKMYMITSPSLFVNETAGFSDLVIKKYDISNLDSNSYEIQLEKYPAFPVPAIVEFITEHDNGKKCNSLMYHNLKLPMQNDGDGLLSVPNGITVNQSRYESFVKPAPTAEALIVAYYGTRNCNYNGSDVDCEWVEEGFQDDNTDAWPENDEVVTSLFGEVQTDAFWRSTAHALEILNGINPEFNARFAQNMAELTFPQIYTKCGTKETAWIVDDEYISWCNPGGGDAYHSNGTNGNYSNLRGWNWYQTRSEAEYVENGWNIDGYCCTIVWHEIGHEFGLNHNICPGTAMEQGRIWNEDDLAAIGIASDPRTKANVQGDWDEPGFKMGIYDAALALGITIDSNFEKLIKDPSLACGKQAQGWKDFAAQIKEDNPLGGGDY